MTEAVTMEHDFEDVLIVAVNDKKRSRRVYHEDCGVETKGVSGFMKGKLTDSISFISAAAKGQADQSQ